MDAITKNGYEYFPIRANFGIDFVPGETISSTSVTSSDGQTGIVDTASIIDWYSPSSPEVIIGIKGGDGSADEDNHIITVTVGTNLGNTYTRTIILFVKDVAQDNFQKMSSETLVFLVDFSNELETGDSIASRTVTAVDASDDEDETTAVIVGSQLSSPRVYVGVTGGEDSENYNITVRIQTDDGYKYSRIITMTVRDE